MPIDGIGINAENWRAKPLKEVVSNLNVVEEEDSECAKWAQAMSAVANAPDNVTYDMAGGSIEEFTAELDEITQNGLPVEEQPEDGAPEDVEGVGKTDEVPPEEAEPEVGDVDDAADEQTKAEAAAGNDPNAEAKDNLVGEPGADEPTSEGEDVTLADESITTDNEEIRKRKIKKGETPEE